MRKSRRIDPDLSVLKNAARFLKKSSSQQMLRANLEFLTDYFLKNPSMELPEHLKP